jgi:WD40 repeat protein
LLSPAQTIKRWDMGSCTATWSGHTDSVRGLALLPGGAGVVSGSHDFTLRVWTLDGATLSELIGHTALVFQVQYLDDPLSGPETYAFEPVLFQSFGGLGNLSRCPPNGSPREVKPVSFLGCMRSAIDLYHGGSAQVACSAAGLVASASEDNTARVWDVQAATCLQVIPHPACVWALCFVPTAGEAEAAEAAAVEDLATGCADAVARVWSQVRLCRVQRWESCES